jgi:hypothetical protein
LLLPRSPAPRQQRGWTAGWAPTSPRAARDQSQMRWTSRRIVVERLASRDGVRRFTGSCELLLRAPRRPDQDRKHPASIDPHQLGGGTPSLGRSGNLRRRAGSSQGKGIPTHSERASYRRAVVPAERAPAAGSAERPCEVANATRARANGAKIRVASSAGQPRSLRSSNACKSYLVSRASASARQAWKPASRRRSIRHAITRSGSADRSRCRSNIRTLLKRHQRMASYLGMRSTSR